LKNKLKSILKDIIPHGLNDLIPSSFDILGSKEKAIAIIEIPEELSEFKIEIAKGIIKVHKNVVSVLAKDSIRYGDFRIRDFKLIYGDKNTEIIHKESGCRFKLDPRKVYFSSRESTERERISAKILDKEEILVMFSGIGSIPICIAKKSPRVKVTAIEINPDAHNYCLQNIMINKVSEQITPILGDVRVICPSLRKLYDRVFMPLPKGAFEFLDVALPLVKREGILHFYHWAIQNNLYEEAELLVQKAANNISRDIKTIDKRKVSAYSPKMSKIRLDIKII
jgi:tRNA (guanine37-N1)-methyltransferase